MHGAEVARALVGRPAAAFDYTALAWKVSEKERAMLDHLNSQRLPETQQPGWRTSSVGPADAVGDRDRRAVVEGADRAAAVGPAHALALRAVAAR